MQPEIASSDPSTSDRREENIEILRQGIWSLLHGFILLQATLPNDEWEPDLLDRSLEALIRGWLEPGETS